MSVKHARKQERARRRRRMKVMGRVAESHAPFWVKMGMRSWNAKRVPEGKRLARLDVLSNVWEIARCEKDRWRRRLGAIGTVPSEVVGTAGLSAMDDEGCFFLGIVVLGLRLDMIFARSSSRKMQLGS